MTRLMLLVGALSACYAPAFVAECALRCDGDRGCPDDAVCDIGLCRSADHAACTLSDCTGTFLPICNVPFSVPFAPEGDETLEIDTDAVCDLVVTQPTGPDVCVLVATTVTISERILIRGSRAFALVSRDGIAITSTGSISTATPDTASAGMALAGSNFVGCPISGDGTIGGKTGSGGAGGSFGTSGGDGGAADPPVTLAAGSVAQPTVLRGGCPGGAGSGVGTPFGGSSGGALLLATHGDIAIDTAGSVEACGTGGSAGGASSGGAGGGSGGMIVLDGRLMSGSLARAFAFGGSGATGGNLTAASFPGSASTNGSIAMTASAPGGDAGNGGSGSPSNIAVGGSAGKGGPNGGGGGGGGGAGWVVVVDATKP